MNSSTNFKDLFSQQSSSYARFRPNYPSALFQYLASLVSEHELAWDCGTGNGQAAVAIAPYFAHVLATDPSAKQLASAQQDPKVEYRVGTAEKTELADHSVDLLLVAQAFHWFKQEQFFAEARRVLKPQGVLALWCYGLCTITPELDQVVMKLYEGMLGEYWEPERKLVEEGYKNIVIPFAEIIAPAFEMKAEWSLEHLLGYLGTWSALQAYINKNNINPLETIYPELQSAWGKAETRTVHWNLAVRVARLNTLA